MTEQNCLNPRFVGRVFRHERVHAGQHLLVLIPDLWGESSDSDEVIETLASVVLIPDLWGESSDRDLLSSVLEEERLNPRFVGRVFRRRA